MGDQSELLEPGLAVGIWVHLSAHTLCVRFSAALVLLLAWAGCNSPASPPTVGRAAPNLGPHVTDVRTEANIVALENEYITDKNSPPPNPTQAAAMKRMEEKKQAEAAKEPEKDTAQTGH